MKISKFLGTCICLVLTSCATRKYDEHSAPPVVIHVRDVGRLNYTVIEGDTVGSIATSHGMTRAELIRLNNLTPPYELYDGQRLVVLHNEATARVDDGGQGDAIADRLNDNSRLEIVQAGGMKTEYHPAAEENGEEESSDEQEKAVEQGERHGEYIWPLKNGRSRITQHYSSQNEYVLIQAEPNESVYAMADGIVKFAGKPADESLESYGSMVIIQHQKQSKVTLYAKLNKTTVKTGEQVKKGQKVGEVKENARGTKLYFEIQDILKGTKNRPPVSPEKLLP